MKQWAHLTTESSSCIAFVSDSGIEKSLYNKCQHNIIYDTIIINIKEPLLPKINKEIKEL